MKEFLELSQMRIIHSHIGSNIFNRGSFYQPYDAAPGVPSNFGSAYNHIVEEEQLNSGIVFTFVPYEENELDRYGLEFIRYSISDLFSLLPEGLCIYVKHKGINELESDVYEVSFAGFMCINSELIDAMFDLFILLKEKKVL